MRTRTGVPIWLMGMCNLSYGFYNGIISFALPQMLAARHVPLQQIAMVSAATGGGMITLFFLGPVLDVWFSRRFYATVLAAISALCLTASMLFQRHVSVLEIVIILGFACSTLSQNALGGWLASIVPRKDESNLSAWTQAASVGAGGISTIVAGEMLRGFPVWIGALSLGILIQLPTLIFLWMPSPSVDRRLARESFGRFFQEVFAVLRRREVLFALALFLTPTGSFAITNLLPAMGDDFSCFTAPCQPVWWRRIVAGRYRRQSPLRPLRKTLSFAPRLLGDRHCRSTFHHRSSLASPHATHLLHCYRRREYLSSTVLDRLDGHYLRDDRQK